MKYRKTFLPPSETRVLVLTPGQLLTTYGVEDFGEEDDRLVLVLVDDGNGELVVIDDGGEERDTRAFASRVSQIGRAV